MERRGPDGSGGMDRSWIRPWRGLLTLLRAGLWEREVDDIACFPLSGEEWKRLFRLARQQTVTGIAFRGLQALPEELLPAPVERVRWTVAVDAVERRNRLMNRALADLYGEFRARGLDPILQKGQGVAAFYADPLLRECGDIDLCFGNSRASERAAECMRRLGAEARRMPDGSLFYRWQGVEIEHHTRLFDLHNPFLQRDARRLIREKGSVRMALPGDAEHTVTVPSPFLNLLLLDLHILKHALGRGIGLRQLCDMARACHRLHAGVDSAEMKACCRRWGLGRWNPLLHAFLTDCLGLPAGMLPYAELAPGADPLLEIVRRGGNFGFYREGREVAGMSRWHRKMATARAFGENLRFALRYAPKEAFWIFTGLMEGQFRS